MGIVKSSEHLDEVFWPSMRKRIAPHLPEKIDENKIDEVLLLALAVEIRHIVYATKEAEKCAECGQLSSFH